MIKHNIIIHIYMLNNPYYLSSGENYWRAECLTKDHKPELEPETSRIESVGGKVVKKSGVARIVWNRPRIGHKVSIYNYRRKKC